MKQRWGKKCAYIVLTGMSICMYWPTMYSLVGKSVFVPRPQGVNGVKELLNRTLINLAPRECIHSGFFSVAPSFSHSVRTSTLAAAVAGDQTWYVSGSQVPNRSGDIIADYFGLPTDYESTLCFKPRVNTFAFDMYWYYNPFCPVTYDQEGQQCCNRIYNKERLFVKINAPLVYTKWATHMCERQINAGDNNHPAGYISSDFINREDLVSSMSEALAGNNAVGDIEALEYGKVSRKSCHTGGLADIRTVFGYRICDNECSLSSLGLLLSIPTTRKNNSCILFEPRLGSNHWEIGVEWAGRWHLWTSAEEGSSFEVYAQLQLSHLISSCDRRSFDLCRNGKGSRYLLLEDMGNPVIGGLQISGAPALVQYHARLVPAINVTTFNVKTKIDVQFDGAVALAYTHNKWDIRGAYGLWARSKEELTCRQKLPSNRYAVKGDAQVYGYDGGVATDFVALNATQHLATLYSVPQAGNTVNNFVNNNIDNPALASLSGAALSQTSVESINNNTGATVLADVQSSRTPLLLTDRDIDEYSGVAPAAVTHQLALEAAYKVKECLNIDTSLGIGSSIEIAQKVQGTRGALSQWSIWLSLGCTF